MVDFKPVLRDIVIFLEKILLNFVVKSKKYYYVCERKTGVFLTKPKEIKKLTYNKNYTKIYFNHVRFFNTPSL